ncbi:MAG TPA: glucosyl-3-phosphoglycerate synthase [Trebonia sp.]|nr:glucosyl-3-phosphoglycerate synthase [Trebonia sp.]
MNDRAEAWLRRRTSHWRDWPADRLLDWKRQRGTRISVVIPARDEEATVGDVVGALRDDLMIGVPLIDELVVMDSDSVDGTARVAERAGAQVYRCQDVAPDLGTHPGKGEALWKSLLVTTGDILVFVDADLTLWGSHFVTGLLGPLLCPGGEQAMLVKACYDRRAGDTPDGGTVGGGRVTELVARPLLSLWWPELAGVAQPLSGEWAARRPLLEELSVPVGYGVEIAVLIDTAGRHGMDAISQVDLGERGHSHQADADLAVMAAEIMLVAERRRPGAWDGSLPQGPELVQFTRADGELRPRHRAVPHAERPPLSSLLTGMGLSAAELAGRDR